MADYKDLPGGRQDAVLSHDEGDGTFTRAVASHLRGWDSTDGAWYRLPVSHLTGALKVEATLAAGTVDIGLVDQGTGGSSAWKVTDAALADGTARIGGTVAVTQSTSPWVVSNGGTFAVQAAATLAAETTKVIGTVNQGTSPWVTSRNWTLASGTDTATVVGTDSTLGATVTPKAASTWDVSDRVGRALGSIANTTFAVTNTGTFATQATATQSGSWILSGSDNISTLPVSARTHNGFTHLYVRDPGVIAVLSELLWEIQQLNLTSQES